LLAIEWWLLGSVLVRYVAGKYASVREGVIEVAWALYLLGMVLFLAFVLVVASGPQPLVEATSWTAQWLLAILRGVWTYLFACAFLAYGLGALAWRRHPKGSPRRARARAAARTSRLALALPSLLMLLLIIFLWGGIFGWVSKPGRFAADPFGGAVPTLAPG